MAHATSTPQTLETLKQGQEISIVSMNSMAMTVCNRVKFHCIKDGKIIFKIPRRQGLYQSQMGHETLLFVGHIEKPFVDSDTSMFAGNACINLIGEPERLRELVKQNINPHFEAFGKVTYRQADEPHEAIQMLFQEEAEKIKNGHAVVRRIVG